MTDKRSQPLMSKFLELGQNILSLTEPVILLQQYRHFSNVPLSSVYVEKFISNIVKNANVTSVTLQMT